MNIGEFVVGERPAPLVYQFQSSGGQPLDITNYAAKFSTREDWAAAPAVDVAPAVVTNAAQGEVTYVWTGAELPTPGHYRAELWVGNGTNRFASVDIEYDVRAAVGSVPNV